MFDTHFIQTGLGFVSNGQWLHTWNKENVTMRSVKDTFEAGMVELGFISAKITITTNSSNYPPMPDVFWTVWHFPNANSTSRMLEYNQPQTDSVKMKSSAIASLDIFSSFCCCGFSMWLRGWVLGVASAGPGGPPSEVGSAQKQRPIGGAAWCPAVRGKTHLHLASCRPVTIN